MFHQGLTPSPGENLDHTVAETDCAGGSGSDAIRPLFLLLFFFLPSAVVGTLSAVRGNKTLGLTIALASLLLVSLTGLAIFTESLHVVL